MTVDEHKLNELVFKMVGDMGAAASSATRRSGRQVGFVPGLGHRRSTHDRRISRPNRYDRTVCPRMVRGSGGIGLHQL